jgi:hypothetical protein
LVLTHTTVGINEIKGCWASSLFLLGTSWTMIVILWAFQCEHEQGGIFKTSFDELMEYSKNILCNNGHNLYFCGKIFCHVYTNGLIIYEFLGWKKNINVIC